MIFKVELSHSFKELFFIWKKCANVWQVGDLEELNGLKEKKLLVYFQQPNMSPKIILLPKWIYVVENYLINTNSRVFILIYWLTNLFCSTGVWTQYLVLARQILYHFIHTPSPESSYLNILDTFDSCQ
jgi:hypothetical protein